MDERKNVFQLFSLLLGLGFSIFILYHLTLIWVYGSVIIFEPNKIILAQEIVTLVLIMGLFVWNIKNLEF